MYPLFPFVRPSSGSGGQIPQMPVHQIVLGVSQLDAITKQDSSLPPSSLPSSPLGTPSPVFIPFLISSTTLHTLCPPSPSPCPSPSPPPLPPLSSDGLVWSSPVIGTRVLHYKVMVTLLASSYMFQIHFTRKELLDGRAYSVTGL